MTVPPVPAAPEAAADDSLIYVGAGPLLAVALGFALMPFRESAAAASLPFAFVLLTISVAAFGGRSAGVATALVSALSMDFFLTRPYLSLRIQDNHDLFAFAGLTVCGLVAASLGSPQRIAALREARVHAQIVHQALLALEAGGPVEPEIARLLEWARHRLPVRALVLRDRGNRVVSSAPHSAGLHPIPAPALEADTLLVPGASAHALRRPLALPEAGARIVVMTHQRQVGWLDFWGDGAPASASSRQTLTSVARILGAMLSRDHGRP